MTSTELAAGLRKELTTVSVVVNETNEEPTWTGGREFVIKKKIGEFQAMTGFYDAREPPYLLYEGSGRNEFFGQRKHHIVRDGETICRVDAHVPAPDADSLSPLSEIDEDGWNRVGIEDGKSRLCGHCRNEAREQGIL